MSHRPEDVMEGILLALLARLEAALQRADAEIADLKKQLEEKE